MSGQENNRSRRILQYALDGEWIREFESIRDACDSVGLVSHSGIIKCCKGESKQAKGFIWRYYSDGFPIKIDAPTKSNVWKEKWGIGSDGYNSIRESTRNTNLDKFGCSHHSQNPEIKERIKETNIQKYGVDNPAKNIEIIKKISATESFNKTRSLLGRMDELEFINKDADGLFIFTHRECGHEFSINRQLLGLRKKKGNQICTKCNPPDSNQVSELENHLAERIASLYGIVPSRNIKGLLNTKHEVDILLDDYSLGIEVNGNRYHNDLNGRGEKYHINKTNAFKEIGIRILHFFEDEIIEKEEIILSMIGNMIGRSAIIFARKCQIREVNNAEAKSFLVKNHLQGFCSSSIRIGLFYDGILVSLMTFGGYRKILGRSSKEGAYELLRLCSQLGTSVVGGASRMLSYFIKKYSPVEILSYANLRWSNGSVYETLGFSFDGNTAPGWSYFYKNRRVHRYELRKSNLIKMGYDPALTEEQITMEMGVPKIYDCGNSRWILKIKTNKHE